MKRTRHKLQNEEEKVRHKVLDEEKKKIRTSEIKKKAWKKKKIKKVFAHWISFIFSLS